YRQGSAGKEEYLAQKAKERLLAEETEAELVRLKAGEERLLRRVEEIKSGRASLSEWLDFGEGRRELLLCLTERIVVYPEKKLAICWRFQEMSLL
ncbi:MAG: hypothetical protein K2P50_13005, partial [Lachnospiraceae bacterium]|nr:hypothetical protein [Lachnospiraceae bacterium]